MAKLTEAKASPTKRFFVTMITRDIAIEDCILDLIDNSIDSAWERVGARPTSLDKNVDLSPFEIRIEATSEQFAVKDNCGGLSLEDAEKYAFNFGRSEDAPTDDFSIGVYGIGLKRAIFKLGRVATVLSHFQAEGVNDEFEVRLDVKKWLKSGDNGSWDFPIYEASKKLDSPGVEVSIKNLHGRISSAFGSEKFINNLRRMIARDYTIHLFYGLRIVVNDKLVTPWAIELREGSEFSPLRLSYDDEGERGEPVTVELIAGMSSHPPDEIDPDHVGGDDLFGWYVACNGRMVLAADKTIVSGWGSEGWPQWHPQYNGFVGIIIFSSKNASALPLTTTKRSVDTASTVYRRAQSRMREVTKEWTRYTNLRKQSLEDAKKKEAETKAAPIFEIKKSAAVQLPKIEPKPKKRVANILYSVPLERARSLGDAFGDINMAYKEIGTRSFEFAFEELVGDE